MPDLMKTATKKELIEIARRRREGPISYLIVDDAFILKEIRDEVQIEEERRRSELKEADRKKKQKRRNSRGEFTLLVDNRDTFNSLIERGGYDTQYYDITEQRFPVRSFRTRKRNLVFLHFNRDITTDCVLKEARKRGLQRPTYEDCLRFGAQYTNCASRFPMVFLHEPVIYNGNQNVLYLQRDDDSQNRILASEGLYSDTIWNGKCRFAFVRPTRKQKKAKRAR